LVNAGLSATAPLVVVDALADIRHRAVDDR
jgi:hypothetical protein